MTEYAKLVVAVDSRQAAKAGKELQQLTGKASKAEKSASSMGRAFGKLAGVLATAFSVREVMQAAEAYTNITNRLKLVTDSAEGLARAQADLFKIAQNARQPLSETAELYQRIATNQDELGLTGAGVARITETISKSLAVSGTSAASAAGAMTQLGQAFASGQLRGEELNSVLENAPALAQALARGLGVTVGELRALGQEGKLTAMNVVDALEQQSTAIDDAFNTLAPTMSGAMTTVTNAFTQLIGKMDETSGASGGVASKLIELGRVLQEPRTIEAAQNLAFALGQVVEWAIDGAVAFSDFGTAIGEWAGRLAVGPADALERVNLEMSQSRERLKHLADELSRPRLLRINPFQSTDELEAEYNSVFAKIKSLEVLKKQLNDAPINMGLPDIGNELDGVLNKLGGFEAVLRKPSSIIAKTVEDSKALAAQLKAEIAARRELTEQEQIRIDILRESGQLRAANDAQFQLEYAEKIAEYEKAGNVAMVQRLETLKRIREIQMNADQAPGTVEGVSQAPGSSGLDAVVGGAGSELIRLQQEALAIEEWRAMELEKQRAFLDAKAINEETHAERVANIHEQSADAVAQVQASQTLAAMAMAQGLSNDLMSLMHQAGQENTAFYKAMFLAQKGMAVAQAIISTELAAVSALAPPPLGLGPVAGAPYAGMIRGLGYASVAMIGAQTAVGLSGMAHDGIDSIPKEGTWLLDKGERVVDRRTNEDLKQFLADGGGGGGGKPEISFTAQVVVESQAGMSQEESRAQGEMAAGAMRATFMSMIEKESRPGGMLWNLYGGGR